MIGSAILFALLGGAAAATWTICLKLGSTKVNAALGAMVITGVAFLVNSMVMLSMKAQGHEIVLRGEAVWLLVLAGIAAAGIDIFGRSEEHTSELQSRENLVCCLLLVNILQ